ncbi:hypothetical protein [Chitinolyticbacter meiyuanensis]|uniref:hypothetical protein n=1 Tax=Chitinolyticbacter meiyuanensis TaxID=682798 RepID=UPI0011E5D777|nr:hypothetical protein [Chitinolyticbacter meiyuanensis]
MKHSWSGNQAAIQSRERAKPRTAGICRESIRATGSSMLMQQQSAAASASPAADLTRAAPRGHERSCLETSSVQAACTKTSNNSTHLLIFQHTDPHVRLMFRLSQRGKVLARSVLQQAGAACAAIVEEAF